MWHESTLNDENNALGVAPRGIVDAPSVSKETPGQPTHLTIKQTRKCAPNVLLLTCSQAQEKCKY